MPIQFFNKNSQATGAFDNGRIQENKPIGFMQDGGKSQAFSNIFYWANAWSDEGGLIALHPHRGFEIMSVVLRGTISHFDTSENTWQDVQEGDVQIIRAGNGISHAEKLKENSRMFQIWFDPDLEKTWHKPASYDVYMKEQFEVIEKDGYKIKVLKGEAGPILMDAEGIEIYDLLFKKRKIKFKLNSERHYSFYVIEGSFLLPGQSVVEDDFFIVSNEKIIEFEFNEDARVFLISNPQKLSYKAYAEMTN